MSSSPSAAPSSCSTRSSASVNAKLLEGKSEAARAKSHRRRARRPSAEEGADLALPELGARLTRPLMGERAAGPSGAREEACALARAWNLAASK